MNSSVFIDAGPLVALINRRDEHHTWAVEQVRTMQPPLITCDAALSEAMHLLGNRADHAQTVRQMLLRESIKLDFSLQKHLSTVLTPMERYADVPMSLADACLVRMCELDGRAKLFTTDGDFRIYRVHGRHIIPLIAPERSTQT